MLQTDSIPESNAWKFWGISDSISQKDVESKFYNISREFDADTDPVNIEFCYRLKSNHWPKNAIVKCKGVGRN